MVERVEAGATLALHHTTMVQALPLHHYTMVQATEAGGCCRTLVYLARIGWTAVDCTELLLLPITTTRSLEKKKMYLTVFDILLV